MSSKISATFSQRLKPFKSQYYKWHEVNNSLFSSNSFIINIPLVTKTQDYVFD